MKALLLSALLAPGALSLCPGRADAQIEKGAHLISFGGGAGIPLNYVSDSYGNMTEFIFAPGPGFGAQYVYHLSPKFGLGIEAGYNSFGEQNHDSYAQLTKLSGKQFLTLGIARFVVNPSKKVRVYVYGGLGMGRSSILARVTPNAGYQWPDTLTREERTIIDDVSSSFVYSTGVGLEGNLGGKTTWGIGTSFTGCGVNETAVSGLFIGLVRIYSANLFGRIGMKF